MPSGHREKRPVATRGPLNLAELAEQGLVELTEVVLADSAALLAVELELLDQLARLEAQSADVAEARERLLGYRVEAGAGDLHDFVERRLVTEYLIATGVDAVLTPLVKGGPRYSHIARDASLVAIGGEVAPEALIHRLTSCPRVLLYGLDGEGAELRGQLLRRAASPSAPGWPERAAVLAEGAAATEPGDLRQLIASIEEGRAVQVDSATTATPARRQPTAAERRRARRMRLNEIE